MLPFITSFDPPAAQAVVALATAKAEKIHTRDFQLVLELIIGFLPTRFF
jgi:hypothetical protein